MKAAPRRWWAKALGGQRDRVFLVSKVYPHNASAEGVDRRVRAQPRAPAHRSPRPVFPALARPVSRSPKPSTLSSGCGRAGKIVRWGVSNFDSVRHGRTSSHCLMVARCATNRVLYNLGERGIEFASASSMPTAWVLPIMAYSPLQQGTLRASPKIGTSCRGACHHAGAASHRVVALASGQRHSDTESGIHLAHVDERVWAAKQPMCRPTRDTLAALDAAFPPPTRRANSARDGVADPAVAAHRCSRARSAQPHRAALASLVLIPACRSHPYVHRLIAGVLLPIGTLAAVGGGPSGERCPHMSWDRRFQGDLHPLRLPRPCTRCQHRAHRGRVRRGARAVRLRHH